MLNFGFRTAMTAAEFGFATAGALNPVKLVRPTLLVLSVPVMVTAMAAGMAFFVMFSLLGV